MADIQVVRGVVTELKTSANPPKTTFWLDQGHGARLLVRTNNITSNLREGSKIEVVGVLNVDGELEAQTVRPLNPPTRGISIARVWRGLLTILASVVVVIATCGALVFANYLGTLETQHEIYAAFLIVFVILDALAVLVLVRAFRRIKTSLALLSAGAILYPLLYHVPRDVLVQTLDGAVIVLFLGALLFALQRGSKQENPDHTAPNNQ